MSRGTSYALHLIERFAAQSRVSTRAKVACRSTRIDDVGAGARSAPPPRLSAAQLLRFNRQSQRHGSPCGPGSRDPLVVPVWEATFKVGLDRERACLHMPGARSEER